MHRGKKASISAVGALQDPLRWRMYWFVRGARRPVTRDEAAAHAGVSRKLAAFHLDKLVSVGLLRAGNEPVRGLRKVGRNPKTYRPAAADITVSIPHRAPDVLAEILVDAAVAENDRGQASETVVRAAYARGEALGAGERAAARPGRMGAERALTLAEDILRRHGFEPCRDTGKRVQLRNCPFVPLAARAPDMVCGINHAYLSGFLAGLGATAVQAVLAPDNGRCCVELRAPA